MAQFSYKARRRSGEVVHGSLDVADRTAALAQIDRLGLFPVSVDAAKGGAAAKKDKAADKKSAAAGVAPSSFRERMASKRKPKLQELATFTQQLANLLQAGMPLTVALNSMTHLETKGIPKHVAVNLRQEVMEGRSLSDAMSKQPLIFTDLYVNMVKAGEQSGALVEVLRRMADHFEKFAAVQAKFTSALIYPAFVAVVGIGIIIFFMTFMLPKFMTLFGNMAVQLPASTQLLMDISKLFTGYWWLMLLILGAAILAFRRFQNTEEGKHKIDEWKMKLPVFGKVMKLNLYGQFARTLSTLLENGVPVLTALKITSFPTASSRKPQPRRAKP
jgi:type II secretory pathway component PulF